MSKTIKLKIEYVEKHKRCGKEYEIHIVPNRFTKLFGEYSALLRSVIVLNKKIKDAKTLEEVKKVQGELEEADLKRILSLKYELIKTVFIANDYEFDFEWMDSKADPTSLNEFISECVLKDAETESKKKELLKTLGL